MTDGGLDSDSPLTLPGFFAALDDGKLLGGVCEDCGEILLPPRPTCYGCGGRNVEVEVQPKTGTIFTYTAVLTPPPALKSAAPYTIAVVELDSGGRLTGRVAADYDDIEIGDRVELQARELKNEERTLALDYELEWPLHIFETLA